MTQPRTVSSKVGDWLQAYTAVSEQLTPQGIRELVKLTNSDNQTGILLGIQAAKIAFANDRAAAYTAALLTANGVKPIPVSFGEEDTDE